MAAPDCGPAMTALDCESSSLPALSSQSSENSSTEYSTPESDALTPIGSSATLPPQQQQLEDSSQKQPAEEGVKGGGTTTSCQSETESHSYQAGATVNSQPLNNEQQPTTDPSAISALANSRASSTLNKQSWKGVAAPGPSRPDRPGIIETFPGTRVHRRRTTACPTNADISQFWASELKWNGGISELLTRVLGDAGREPMGNDLFPSTPSKKATVSANSSLSKDPTIVKRSQPTSPAPDDLTTTSTLASNSLSPAASVNLTPQPSTMMICGPENQVATIDESVIAITPELRQPMPVQIESKTIEGEAVVLEATPKLTLTTSPSASGDIGGSELRLTVRKETVDDCSEEVNDEAVPNSAKNSRRVSFLVDAGISRDGASEEPLLDTEFFNVKMTPTPSAVSSPKETSQHPNNEEEGGTVKAEGQAAHSVNEARLSSPISGSEIEQEISVDDTIADRALESDSFCTFLSQTWSVPKFLVPLSAESKVTDVAAAAAYSVKAGWNRWFNADQEKEGNIRTAEVFDESVPRCIGSPCRQHQLAASEGGEETRGCPLPNRDVTSTFPSLPKLW